MIYKAWSCDNDCILYLDVVMGSASLKRGRVMEMTIAMTELMNLLLIQSVVSIKFYHVY